MPNLSVIVSEIKKLQKSRTFDGTSGLKLEMTSYLDNAYNATNFVVLKSSWPILCSYQVLLLSDTKWQILGLISISREKRPILVKKTYVDTMSALMSSGKPR